MSIYPPYMYIKKMDKIQLGEMILSTFYLDSILLSSWLVYKFVRYTLITVYDFLIFLSATLITAQHKAFSNERSLLNIDDRNSERQVYEPWVSCRMQPCGQPWTFSCPPACGPPHGTSSQLRATSDQRGSTKICKCVLIWVIVCNLCKIYVEWIRKKIATHQLSVANYPMLTSLNVYFYS